MPGRRRGDSFDPSPWSPRRWVLPALLAAAGYWVVFGGEYSMLELAALRDAVVVEEARLAEVDLRIDSLGAWRDSLENDPATVERVAREEFGMIRDGETLYRFVEADPDEGEADRR